MTCVARQLRLSSRLSTRVLMDLRSDPLRMMVSKKTSFGVPNRPKMAISRLLSELECVIAIKSYRLKSSASMTARTQGLPRTDLGTRAVYPAKNWSIFVYL